MEIAIAISVVGVVVQIVLSVVIGKHVGKKSVQNAIDKIKFAQEDSKKK